MFVLDRLAVEAQLAGDAASAAYRSAVVSADELLAAVPVADPAHRRPQRVLLSDELPGNIYKRGEAVEPVSLQQVSPGHYVAREPASSALRGPR